MAKWSNGYVRISLVCDPDFGKLLRDNSRKLGQKLSPYCVDLIERALIRVEIEETKTTKRPKQEKNP